MPVRQQMRCLTSIRATVFAATSTALSVVAASGTAYADSAAAQALYEEGRKLEAQNRWAEACDAFEASVRAEAAAGALSELATCRAHTGQLASAWSAYKEAAARVRDQVRRNWDERQASQLERRLSYLKVSVVSRNQPPSLTLTRNGAPFDPSLWNRRLPVDGGSYLIAARAPGCKDWQATIQVSAERDDVALTVPAIEPVSVSPGSPTMLVPAADASERSTWSRGRKVSIALLGAGVVAAAGGAAFGLESRAKEADAVALCPKQMACGHVSQTTALIQASRSAAVEADLAFGVAAAAAIGAGVLWLAGGPDKEAASQISVVPSIAPSASSIVVSGRF